MLIRKNQIIVFTEHVEWEGNFYDSTYKAKVEFKAEDVEEAIRKRGKRKTNTIDFMVKRGLIKPFDVYEWEL